MRPFIPFLLFLALPLIALAQTTTAKPPAKKPLPTYAPPTAVIDTTAGKLRCTLFPKQAPIGVANFIGLATGTKDWTNPVSGRHVHGEPLYDGTIFHRVIPGFMIQGGDPGGSGAGEIGFTIKDELRPDLLFDRPGRLAYANKGPDTSSSQFFITETEQPDLNPCFDQGGCERPYGRVPKDSGYTIFGQCDQASVDLVKKIASAPRDGNNHPYDPVKINHIAILHAGSGITHSTMTHHPKKPNPSAPKPQ